MRFFLTAREEIRNIRDAMELKGLSLTPGNLWKKPSLLFEGFLTPLLVRSSTVAEELSAASITRGLDNPGSRTAFTRLRLTGKDFIVTLLFSGTLCGVLFLRAVMGVVL